MLVPAGTAVAAAGTLSRCLCWQGGPPLARLQGTSSCRAPGCSPSTASLRTCRGRSPCTPAATPAPSTACRCGGPCASPKVRTVRSPPVQDLALASGVVCWVLGCLPPQLQVPSGMLLPLCPGLGMFWTLALPGNWRCRVRGGCATRGMGRRGAAPAGQGLVLAIAPRSRAAEMLSRGWEREKTAWLSRAALLGTRRCARVTGGARTLLCPSPAGPLTRLGPGTREDPPAGRRGWLRPGPPGPARRPSPGADRGAARAAAAVR